MSTMGYKQSEEHKNKLSLAHLGKRLSEAHKKKLSKIKMGKVSNAKGKHWKVINSSRIYKSGENSCAWKGDDVGYHGLHKWIRKILGNPNECEFCGKEKTTPKSIQWANKSHQYKRLLTDWISLCVFCHRKYDGEYRRNLV